MSYKKKWSNFRMWTVLGGVTSFVPLQLVKAALSERRGMRGHYSNFWSTGNHLTSSRPSSKRGRRPNGDEGRPERVSEANGVRLAWIDERNPIPYLRNRYASLALPPVSG